MCTLEKNTLIFRVFIPGITIKLRYYNIHLVIISPKLFSKNKGIKGVNCSCQFPAYVFLPMNFEILVFSAYTVVTVLSDWCINQLLSLGSSS